MSDSGKVARLTALIAGNGYVLAQIYSFYIDGLKAHGYRQMGVGLCSLALAGLIGIAAAYGALVLHRSPRLAIAAETTSGAMFLFSVGVWLAYAWFGS